jgi:hypothetical protein
VKQALIAGKRIWKKHLSDWARCQKAIGGVYLTWKWKAETLQPGLEFNNVKPQLKSGIFKCISWLSGSFFFLGFMIRVLEEGVKTYLIAPLFVSVWLIPTHRLFTHELLCSMSPAVLSITHQNVPRWYDDDNGTQTEHSVADVTCHKENIQPPSTRGAFLTILVPTGGRVVFVRYPSIT